MEIRHGLVYGIEVTTEMIFDDGDSRKHTNLEYNFFTYQALAWDYLKKAIVKWDPDAKIVFEDPEGFTLRTEEVRVGFTVKRSYRIATICVYDRKIDLK